MAKLDILTSGNEILRKTSTVIDKVTPEIKELIDDMFDTMYSAKGVGLAAPQIGINQRIVVMDVSEDGSIPIALINPKIISKSGRIKSEEGCLSVPGIEGTVKRHKKVIVKGLNINGDDITFEAEGLLSICVQHEIDHLDGILFIDKVA